MYGYLILTGLGRVTIGGAIGNGTGSTIGSGIVGDLDWKNVLRVRSAEFVFVPMSMKALVGAGFWIP